jgi:hypothetical protein
LILYFHVRSFRTRSRILEWQAVEQWLWILIRVKVKAQWFPICSCLNFHLVCLGLVHLAGVCFSHHFNYLWLSCHLNFDGKYFYPVASLKFLVRKRGLACCRGCGRMSWDVKHLNKLKPVHCNRAPWLSIHLHGNWLL